MSVDPRKYLGLGPLKKPLFGHNRSHALNATQKISKPVVMYKKKYIRKPKKEGRGSQRYACAGTLE